MQLKLYLAEDVFYLFNDDLPDNISVELSIPDLKTIADNK